MVRMTLWSYTMLTDAASSGGNPIIVPGADRMEAYLSYVRSLP
jgi:hypothetical protein